MARVAVSPSPALRLIPSGRSLAVGFGLLGAALLLYVGARESSVFAVRTIEVEAVPPAQARVARRALGDLAGTTLLRVDADAIERRLERVPHVHLLRYDRAFPNHLRVRVSVERAVAVLRRGSERWLVSGETRILRRLDRPLRRPLPVVWADRNVEPEVGALLRAEGPVRGVRTLSAAAAFEPRLARSVWYVKSEERGLTLVLRDHVEVRLGNARELPLKLAAARRVLAALEREGASVAYLDVSVPERPVAGTTLNSQVEP